MIGLEVGMGKEVVDESRITGEPSLILCTCGLQELILEVLEQREGFWVLWTSLIRHLKVKSVERKRSGNIICYTASVLVCIF